MKSWIIYDSFFGNTEQVAKAVGGVFSPGNEVEIFRAGDVPLERLEELDLLIVGSPTRAFRPSPDVTKFLNSIPRNALDGVKFAAFDTRITLDDAKPRILRFFIKLFGWAAEPIADRLGKKGGERIVPPEGFAVKDSEGPLKEGELERAADWARRILSRL